MSAETQEWKSFWQEKRDAGHRHSSESWLRLHTLELLMFVPTQVDNLLEIGCGCGDLYPFIREHVQSYTGLDFSPSMLKEFKSKWPEANLIEEDATKLNIEEKKFDCVISTQLCQYLDVPALKSHLRRVKELMKPDGVCVIGNIPDLFLRLHYYGNFLRSDKKFSLRSFIFDCWAAARGRDGLGHWYSRKKITSIAKGLGLACKTYSSCTLEYRFHAIITDANGNRS